MQTLFSYINKHAQLLFAAVGTLLVLGPLLLPGYVLTLDMVFGPVTHINWGTGEPGNMVLWQILFYAMSFLMPLWVVEKLLLLTLVFLLFYLPLKFFPLEVMHNRLSSASEHARYVYALFIAINPFVYERLLVGQWAVLAGYALLVPSLFYLVRLLQEMRLRDALMLSMLMVVISTLTLHVLMIVMVVLASSVLAGGVYYYSAHTEQHNKTRAVKLLLLWLISQTLLLLASLYWLVPLIRASHSTLGSVFAGFDNGQWETFASAPGAFVGVGGNLALLYGFWVELYPTLERFLSAKDIWFVYYPVALLLLSLLLFGLYGLVAARETRTLALGLFVGGCAAWVFAHGATGGYIGQLNIFLMTHIPLWSGFRDAQKWVMALCVIYALCLAYASVVLAQRSRVWVVLLLCVPLLYTPLMLWGIMGQVRAVDYPASWYEADAMLSSDPVCKAVFLPWYQYYALSFNDDIITGNPAANFFHCTVISSRDAEVGTVRVQSATPEYERIAPLIEHPYNYSREELFSQLSREGVRYIVETGSYRMSTAEISSWLEENSYGEKVFHASGSDIVRVYIVPVL